MRLNRSCDAQIRLISHRAAIYMPHMRVIALKDPLPASSGAPALASLHAYVRRDLRAERAKRMPVWPAKIFCGGCRAFIRRLLANFWRTGADKAAANLVSRCPVRIPSFPHVWSRRGPGKNECSSARGGNCFRFSPLSKIDTRTSEMSTYFYRARTTRRIVQCVSIWNYGDA